MQINDTQYNHLMEALRTTNERQRREARIMLADLKIGQQKLNEATDKWKQLTK